MGRENLGMQNLPARAGTYEALGKTSRGETTWQLVEVYHHSIYGLCVPQRDEDDERAINGHVPISDAGLRFTKRLGDDLD